MSANQVLITDWYAGDFAIEEAALAPLGWGYSPPEWKTAPPAGEQEAEILARIRATSQIVGVLFILAPVTRKIIEALPDYCIHMQRIGIGLDNLDIAAARARGFSIGNTPGYATEEVAVQALAMMLSLHRQLGETQRVLAEGQWRIQPPRPIERLSTLTVGIIGLGRIGKKFAEMVRPLVKRVIFHNSSPTDAPHGVASATLDEVLQASDVLSLHCPLAPSTRNIISREALQKMKPTALLINVSRGALVDAVALHDAIQQGRLAGAGLDVFEPDILPMDSPLHTLKNVILTSHTAWYSRHSVIDARTEAIAKLIAAVQTRASAIR